MEPASTIIRKLGGVDAVAKLLGLWRTAPFRWTYPRERGGTAGLIPQKYHRTLIAHAKTLGIRLRPADFSERDQGQDDEQRLAG